MCLCVCVSVCVCEYVCVGVCVCGCGCVSPSSALYEDREVRSPKLPCPVSETPGLSRRW